MHVCETITTCIQVVEVLWNECVNGWFFRMLRSDCIGKNMIFIDCIIMGLEEISLNTILQSSVS